VAFEYAIEKLEEKRTSNPALTIDKYRLFNNMLSSQPLCFNLFADLRAGLLSRDQSAAAILKAMFSAAPMAEIESLHVEDLPQPLADYINDKTAFDAAIRFKDESGARGIASIETKYTDTLGKGSASAVRDQIALLDAWGMCTESGLAHFRERGISQIGRNLLLTVAYQRRHGLTHAVNYVSGLRDDATVVREVNSLRAKLVAPFTEQLQALPLETLVARARSIAQGHYANVFEKFEERYLAFDSSRSIPAKGTTSCK
jgi:hypothetical protein